MTLDVDSNRVTVELGGTSVEIAESYEIASSVMQVPSAFAIKLGYGGPASTLAFLYPPRTDFRLFIGGVLQFVGRTDGFTIEASESGGTITLRGRDMMADLVDGFVSTERSFSEATFADLVGAAMTETFGAGNEPDLVFTNEANRKAIVNAPVKQTASPSDLVDPNVFNAETQQKALQAKLGERWYPDFIKPELDRAGLFLWAGASGELILTKPNASQRATFQIVRKREPRLNTGVVSATLKNETTNRFTSCEIHCRAGGGKEPRTKAFGLYEDQEMKALGYTRRFVDKDAKAKSVKQAEYLARKRVADSCRSGWSLTYEVAGHTSKSLIDGNLAVWAPDTIVNVDDDELGIFGDFYIESVRHRSGPQKTTTLELMRPDDLVFGEDPPTAGQSGLGGAAAAPKVRVGETVVTSGAYENLRARLGF